MTQYEVPEPILNTPFDEPARHWFITEGEPPEERPGRRPAMYYYRDPKAKPSQTAGSRAGIAIELKLVNRVRERVAEWRRAGYPGVTRTTDELLRWWRRDGREQRLFFAQLEAAETIIFLNEGRADLRQGTRSRSTIRAKTARHWVTRPSCATPAKWPPGREKRP